MHTGKCKDSHATCQLNLKEISRAWSAEESAQLAEILEAIRSALPLPGNCRSYLGAFTRFRLACLPHEPLDIRIQHLFDAADELESLPDRTDNPNCKSEYYALLAGVHGTLSALNPKGGNNYRLKYSTSIQSSKQHWDSNPRALLLEALSLRSVPKWLGGGADNALAGLNKAAQSFLSDNTRPCFRWGADDCQLWLGHMHKTADRHANARDAYRCALRINPHLLRAQRELSQYHERVAIST